MTKLNEKGEISNTYVEKKEPRKPHSKNCSLDILEHLWTKRSEKHINYFKRAQAKAITNTLVYKLLQVPESKLKKSYLATYSCSDYLYQDGLKVTSMYCGHRWCYTCNGIRTMKFIKGYQPSIDQMEDPYFVTLTIVAIKQSELKHSIGKMYKDFQKINDRLRKRRKRGKGTFKMDALRKTECNFNNKTKTFHPHFHILIDGKENAETLIKEWLKQTYNTTRSAQDMRPADRLTVNKELFKYFSKIINSGKFDASAQNSIYEAMKGRRLYQNYGIVKKVSEEIE